MAETVTLPGGKKVPKNVILVGGLIAVGMVGYAWFTKGVAEGGDEAPVEETPDPVPPPTDTPGFEVTGGGPPILENDDWTELAVQRLSNQGVSATALYSALGKFLARLPLNTTDADLVQQAIAAAGMPPQNGPWTIIRQTTGGSTAPVPKPGKPGFLQARGGRGFVQLNWLPASGHVAGYEVRRMDTSHWIPVGNVVSFKNNALVKKNTRFTYSVRAIGPTGVRGDSATASATSTR